jgi:hypothetical protein
VHQTEQDPLRLRADDYTEVKFAVTGDGPGAPLSTASVESEFPAAVAVAGSLVLYRLAGLI